MNVFGVGDWLVMKVLSGDSLLQSDFSRCLLVYVGTRVDAGMPVFEMDL